MKLILGRWIHFLSNYSIEYRYAHTIPTAKLSDRSSQTMK